MVKRMVVNLSLLIGIAFTIWYIAVGLLTYAVAGVAGGKDWYGNGVFWFILMFPRLLIGGTIHQFILTVLPDLWSDRWRRAAAVLSAGVIYPWAALLGEGWALVPGLIIYGMVLRMPRGSRAKRVVA